METNHNLRIRNLTKLIKVTQKIDGIYLKFHKVQNSFSKKEQMKTMNPLFFRWVKINNLANAQPGGITLNTLAS